MSDPFNYMEGDEDAWADAKHPYLSGSGWTPGGDGSINLGGPSMTISGVLSENDPILKWLIRIDKANAIFEANELEQREKDKLN